MFRRKPENSLEQRLAEAIFRQSPDAMLLIQNGVFTACNNASEGLYDQARGQIIGRSPVDFSAPAQGDGRPSRVHVEERLSEAQAKGFSRFEWLNQNRRGEVVRLLITLIPTRIESGGEVLVLAQSLADTAAVIDELRHGLDELAHGNLACQINRPFRTDYEGLRASFNSAVDAFAGSMGNVMQTAQMVANGADEIQSAAHDLSSRTEQQAMKVETTVRTLGEISEGMGRSAGAARQANALVAETRQRAEESGSVVARTVEAMAAIETSSREISDIISVIDGIAFQTNLLALNAGVEAARAGDAGRGFAVVASEVRALAQRSADAAKDIKARIQGSAEQVANGVSLVTQTGTALSRIAEGVSEVSGVISQIAEDTRIQADHLRHVNGTVGEMDQITQSNAAMSEEASAAARSLAAQSGTLMQELARFRQGGSSGDSRGFAVRRAA